MKRVVVEASVGVFMIIAIVCLVFLAFKVSGLTSFWRSDSYSVTADFQNIGDLKNHAPVTLAGVKIGEVANIALNSNSLDAVVTLNIENRYNKIIGTHASANIYTAGLLGSNYIAIIPGYQDDPSSKPQYLHAGSKIQDTQPAIILENLIGQLLFNLKK